MQKRIDKFGIRDTFTYKPYPVTFWDLYGKFGHPIRATVSDMGPSLLARICDLTEIQEGILHIAFRVADDKGLILTDLKDLRAILNHINDRKSNDDNTDGADQEHFQHFFEEVSQVTGIAGNKDHTGDLLVTDDQRQGNGVVLALINTAQIGDALIGQFLTDGCQNIGWNGAGTVGTSLLTGADQRIAVDIGKENIRVDGLGDRDINIIQSGRYLVGTVHIDAEFLGSLQCIDCVLVQGRKTVILEVLRREAQEHDAQKTNGQQNQTRAGEEVFSE